MIRKPFSKFVSSKKPASKKEASGKKKRGSLKPKAKARKPAAVKKKAVSKKPAPEGDHIGKVTAFFRIPVVAVIKLMKGSLRIGDQIWIKGHTTDLKQTIISMQINHQPIQQVRKGDEFGLKISSRARRGDRVYRINP